MGKYNDLLLEYMQRKNTIVKKHTGLVLTRKLDMAELRTWSEQMCSIALHGLSLAKDSTLCPWCIVNRMDCTICGYGKRNGICDNISGTPQPRYRKINTRLLKQSYMWYIKSIRRLPGMSCLVAEIQYLYYKIRETENTQ